MRTLQWPSLTKPNYECLVCVKNFFKVNLSHRSDLLNLNFGGTLLKMSLCLLQSVQLPFQRMGHKLSSGCDQREQKKSLLRIAFVVP
mmetsp:Transcript_23548/g.27281  ORF Transcript_23548/g.27281 Transcript_23548/m.27281 type:complete len:87 (+) Transcript_23548:57-317(+)